jgi:hypothetical protein
MEPPSRPCRLAKTACVGRARPKFAAVLRRFLLAALLCVSAALATAPSALAADWAGSDPVANLPAPNVPMSCWSDGTGPECMNAALALLNEARASLGQPSYQLPSNFAALSPDQQAFVLADLDRVLYGLPAVPGLTGALSNDAMAGVAGDRDPQASDPNLIAWTANWAGGFPNILYAYEAWMYDDGPGSQNLDCTASDTSGCWGHRHDILFKFGSAGVLAMGVAAGTDPSGTPGFAMLLAEGAPGERFGYTYSWAAAVASGANGGDLGPGNPGAGSGSQPSSPPAGQSPARAAGHPRLSVSLSTIAIRKGRVSFAVRITSGSGTPHAVAISGRRLVRLNGWRRGSTLLFGANLPSGVWKLLITYSPRGDWSASAATVRTVIIR